MSNSITPHEAHDVVEVLQGFEAWRRKKAQEAESPLHDPLSVSTYLDEYAKQRALDILTEIQAVYANKELTWQEVDAAIRNLIGVE